MIFALFFILLLPVSTQATTYYISPSGSNANAGTSSGTPWLTFAYALDPTRASCGDILLLLDGTYGAGTSTGQIDLNARVCTLGDELTIRANTQRQAKIVGDGTGYTVRVRASAYIVLDGLYAVSTDNNYRPADTGELGIVISVETSNHVTVRSSVVANPNRYGNTSAYQVHTSQDVLLEDNEAYVFHRHCVLGWVSERVTVRRQYCNPRGGKISGGFSVGGMPLGSGDSVFSMYPCKDCILENAIADGTESPMYLNEMNAAFFGSIPMSGPKILGSICYKCNAGNGIYPNSRTSADLNHTPQNITIKDVAIVDWASAARAIRCSDCVNTTIDHVTVLATGTTGNGIHAEDTAFGGTAAQNTITITNSIVQGVTTTGFSVSGYNTWSGDELHSYNNGTAYSPALPSNWTNAATTDPQLGTCKLWVPAGAAAKGAGTGGSDIGATVLYRYVDGVLTTTPLWDTTTGEFPHGAATADGVNRVTSTSIDSIHTRLNVNAGGCSFPTGYGGGGGSTTVVKGTTAASGLTTTATPLVWNHTISATQDRLLVCIGLRDTANNVGSVSSIDVSGQAMTLVKRQATTVAARAVEMWSLASPTAGTRTITATLTGNITGALGRSMEFDATSGLNTAVSDVPVLGDTTLSMTAPTNTNELLVDCGVSSSSATWTTGVDQTAYASLSHATQTLRLEASTQNGSSGGVLDDSVGSSVYIAGVGVSLIPTTPDPPGTAVLTQTDYLLVYPIGTEAGALPVKYWLTDTNAKNLSIHIQPTSSVRVRAMITGSGATTSPFGVALYCRKDADSYTKAVDSFGANVFRLYGAGATPDIPSSLTPTSNRLCSASCVVGAMLRDQSSSFTVQALTIGQSIELDTVIYIIASPGVTVNCRYQKDDGTALNVYTNTATMIIDEPAAGGMGF